MSLVVKRWLWVDRGARLEVKGEEVSEDGDFEISSSHEGDEGDDDEEDEDEEAEDDNDDDRPPEPAMPVYSIHSILSTYAVISIFNAFLAEYHGNHWYGLARPWTLLQGFLGFFGIQTFPFKTLNFKL